MFRISSVLRILRERRSLFLVSLAALFYVFGNGGMWFVFPLLAKKLAGNFVFVGLLVAVPYAVSLLLDIPIGVLSDYLGRKKIFAFGLVLMALLGVVLPHISSVQDFVLFMIAFGAANQFIFVSGRAFLMDISPQGKTSEYFGLFEAVAQIGFAVGPIIAGILLAESWTPGVVNTGLFYVLMCILALLVVLMLRETVRTEKLGSILQKFRQEGHLFLSGLSDFRELRSTGLMILFLTFFLMVVDGLIWTMEPLYTTLGLEPEMAGIILSMFVLPYILFNVPAGVLADKLGKTKIMSFGLLVAGVSLIVFGHSRTPLLLIVSAFIATVGLAFVRPSIGGLLTDLAERKQKGGIVGVWDIAEDAGYIIGPVLGGLIAEYYGNVGAAFTGMGILVLLLVPFVLWTTKKP